jgi:hypothetical protein
MISHAATPSSQLFQETTIAAALLIIRYAPQSSVRGLVRSAASKRPSAQGRPDWAYLSAANLSGANLSGADLSEANLSEANLSGADLENAHLCRTIRADWHRGQSGLPTKTSPTKPERDATGSKLTSTGAVRAAGRPLDAF